MNLSIHFDEPYIRREQISRLQPTDLNDFYASASEVDRLNLFFVLLNTLHSLEQDGDPVLEAHLCFLLAYYLFVPLTPPGSCALALHYIRQAVALHPLPEYREWLERMEQGN